MRYCRACGEPLNEDGHTVTRGRRLVVVPGRSRPSLAVRPGKSYACKVRLIAESPGTGKVFVPNTGDRMKRINNRFVAERRLAEGGDLHT
jgi:hypothetical protein